MRLWHQSLILYLDNKRLLSQHRECCALRGKGWKKKHSTVDYVFKYTPSHLYIYHRLVMAEMLNRDFHLKNTNWYRRTYRGKNIDEWLLVDAGIFQGNYAFDSSGKMFILPIYKEHDNAYLRECLLLLKSKGAELTNDKSIDEMLIELDLKSVE